MIFTQDFLKASLVYNGKKILLSKRNHSIDGTLIADFSVTPYGSGYYLTFKLKNIGNVNSDVVVRPLTLDMTLISEDPFIYRTLAGDSCGGDSFMPNSFTPCGHYHEEPFGGRSSNTTGFPYFDIQSGSCALAFAIGWSGQWSKDIDVYDNTLSLKIGLCDSEFYLKPGEEFSLPSLFAVYSDEKDPAVSARRHLKNITREYFSPRSYLKEVTLPFAIQCFDRYFQGICGSRKDPEWATENGQIRTADGAAKIKHIDTLWLDAAWFYDGFPKGVGNYRFTEGFPNGLKSVSDHAHALGMKFMLWFEPERIAKGSDLYERDEFLLSHSQNPDNKLFYLGNEDAWQWLFSTLSNMIEKNGIDIFRQDFNMDPLPYFRENDEPCRVGVSEIKHINGLYKLWDALIEKFPTLLIDNCASGGRRLDLESLKRSVSLWRSDTGCFPETGDMRVNMWSQNQISALSVYIPYHSCAVWDFDAYTVRSNATHGLACNFDILSNGFDFPSAEKALEEAKRLSKYWNKDFYPLTEPSVDESTWFAYALSDTCESLIYVFRRPLSENEGYTLGKCVDCGKYAKFNFEPAKGHSWHLKERSDM